MRLYQRIDLETGDPIGGPGQLPADLVGGLSDEDLAVLGTLGPAAHYLGQGFVPYDPPPPEPPPVLRWIHKAEFYQRFTQAERIAIEAAEASDPLLRDFRRMLDAADNVLLDHIDVINGLAYLAALGLIGALRPDQIRA